MTDVFHTSTNLMLAYSFYAVGAASPGPSNLAVIATAMSSGRRPALVFALGVVSGSTFWGLLAAFGLSTLLSTYSAALVGMKMMGGGYLLWLAARSARSALSSAPACEPVASAIQKSYVRTYASGAAMHLTNPKAIFLWLSIVSLALPVDATPSDALRIVLGCTALALLVFCGYAWIFSTAVARRVYRPMRRWFEGILAVLFGYAGSRMLATSVFSGNHN